jgi:hypothetical protein
MSLDLHRRAELLMGHADALLVQGKPEEAAQLYRSAAGEEAAAFELIPLDRERTRGIVAMSSVALYRKAGVLDQAIRQAHYYLSLQDLPGFARHDIGELLDDMRAEQLVRAEGRKLSPDTFEWVLRGPLVGPGIARIGAISETIGQVEKYGVRVFEYLSGMPARTSTKIPAEVRAAFDMLVMQPTSGSFRFQVRFSTPMMQLSLFRDEALVRPEEMGPAFGRILGAAAEPDSGELQRTVGSQEYREVFLRLLRSLAPDGKELSTIEVNGFGDVAFLFATLLA